MQALSFTSFPNLTTKRLVLRQLQLSDDANIMALRSNEHVNKYIDRPKQITIEEAQAFIHKINSGIGNNKWTYWAITLKEQDDLIGTICLWNFSKDYSVAEIGYELLPRFQGKGIMQEAFSIVLEFGFKILKLQSIEAYTHRDNVGSTRLLVKNKFRKATGTEAESNNNELVFVLTNEAFCS